MLGIARVSVIFLALAAMGLPADLLAQDIPAKRKRDISVETTVKRLRAREPGPSTYMILRQAYGPVPATDLDALADSLVVIVLEYKPGDPKEKGDIALRMISFLAIAGSGQTGIDYPGAFDRLVQIFEGTKDSSLRAPTLSNIARMPDTTRAINYLSKVATAKLQDEDGYLVMHAIFVLASEMGPRGIERLHQLYNAGEITHPTARNALWQVRQHLGWECVEQALVRCPGGPQSKEIFLSNGYWGYETEYPRS